MSPHYIWADGGVVPLTDEEDIRVFYNHLCVDTFFPPGSISRYGRYRDNGRWVSVPYRDLPAEFKTHLLLLGVS